MKISRTAAVLVIVSITAVAWAGDVNTDWDHGVDFSQFKTYAWTKGTPIENQLMQDRAVRDIDEQLQAKGLKKVDSRADLWVALHAATHDDKQLDSTGFGYGGFWGWGGLGTTTTEVVNIPVGSLIVDMVDVGDNKLVWRGSASNVVIPENPEKASKRLDKTIEKMFNNYPPEQ